MVTRPVHAVAAPYSSYADYVQQGADELSAQASDYYTEESAGEDEDDERVWERLRANAQDEARTSDVAPRGAHTAWETPEDAYHARQDQAAQYYAQQQQEAQYYAQQQQEAQYAQHQQAQYYAQQEQQAQYQAAQAFAAQSAPAQVSPYDATAAYEPSAASYGEQATWQQPAAIHDDSFESKRSGGLQWFAVLLVGGGLAAGGVVGYPRLMQMKTAQIAPASISALPMAASAAAAIGTEEARARDALFGTHTAPSPAPTPTPSVSAVPPSEPAAPAAALLAEAPSAPASEIAQAPAPAKKTSALRSASTQKKAKRGKAAKAAKAKKSAELTAGPQRKPAKAKRPRGDTSIASGENSNDPLMGI